MDIWTDAGLGVKKGKLAIPKQSMAQPHETKPTILLCIPNQGLTNVSN